MLGAMPYGGDNKIGWIHNRGVNGSGGLLSMWHKEAFSYESHSMGMGYIAIVGQHEKSSHRCCGKCVCGMHIERKEALVGGIV